MPAVSQKFVESRKRNLPQARAYAEGTADVSQYHVHAPREIDVRAIRSKLGMTQKEFARQFWFRVNTLRDWEHRRRVPLEHMRAYLLVIDRAPKAVQKALRAA
jgi:putative transcriptional regulator